jgi:hypothetical protein
MLGLGNIIQPKSTSLTRFVTRVKGTPHICITLAARVLQRDWNQNSPNPVKQGRKYRSTNGVKLKKVIFISLHLNLNYLLS